MPLPRVSPVRPLVPGVRGEKDRINVGVDAPRVAVRAPSAVEMAGRSETHDPTGANVPRARTGRGAHPGDRERLQPDAAGLEMPAHPEPGHTGVPTTAGGAPDGSRTRAASVGAPAHQVIVALTSVNGGRRGLRGLSILRCPSQSRALSWMRRSAGNCGP